MAIKRMVLGVVALCLPVLSWADVGLSNAWVREAPPNVRVMAAYMIIHNKVRDTITINQVTSPQFERVEIHDTYSQDGMMRMKKIDKLEIMRNDTAELLTGGMHMMLIKPLAPLKDGDKVTLQFHLSNGSQRSFELPVKKALHVDHDHHQH